MREKVRGPLGHIRVLFGFLAVLLVAAGCSEDDERTLRKVSGDNQVGLTGLELATAVAVRVQDDEGNGIRGETVTFEVTAGGGTVSSPSETTDSDGLASVRWTMGAPPVWNRLRASSGSRKVEFTAWANPGQQPALDVVLPAAGFDFAYEDLAFGEGRGLFLGSPGAILNIPAPGESPVEIELTGETIESPSGIAFGLTGDLYVCENDEPNTSVKRIRPSGLGEILSDGFGGRPFDLPNYIAVHSSGEIYLASTCDQMIYRISPTTRETTEFLSIPGPNGIAFDAEEAYLYILSENPAIFCIPSSSTWGGLYRVSLGPDRKPGELEILIDGFAIAGDGLAFDVEGNLYVVFSGLLGQGSDKLDNSSVFVYTPDGRFNEFFHVDVFEAEIITNIAFGVEPFDPYSIYAYGFFGKVYQVEVGIQGKTLP